MKSIEPRLIADRGLIACYHSARQTLGGIRQKIFLSLEVLFRINVEQGPFRSIAVVQGDNVAAPKICEASFVVANGSGSHRVAAPGRPKRQGRRKAPCQVKKECH